MTNDNPQLNKDSIAMIAHEIRNALSANKWVFEMVLGGDLGPITDDQKIFLEKSAKNNNRTIELVSALVDAEKHNHINETLEFKPVDIVELTKDILLDFEVHKNRKTLKLEFSSPFDETALAEVNIKKLKSAISELIHNAVKYTPEGFVRVGVHDLGENLSIEIQDSGIGISEENQKHIFEKFFRADNAEEHEEIGSGLGLFAARHVVEMHGGTLTFQSIENSGSKFTITIPKNH
jgi:two-component system phosphate regulon sensor histidine kinase PhoR